MGAREDQGLPGPPRAGTEDRTLPGSPQRDPGAPGLQTWRITHFCGLSPQFVALGYGSPRTLVQRCPESCFVFSQGCVACIF